MAAAALALIAPASSSGPLPRVDSAVDSQTRRSVVVGALTGASRSTCGLVGKVYFIVADEAFKVCSAPGNGRLRQTKQATIEPRRYVRRTSEANGRSDLVAREPALGLRLAPMCSWHMEQA
ncbi:hypothetical protein CKAH01_01569 [Colletotrichum kahawae]|uniref:Uncharacterized protein n=1 Tax=Colletotrichum kahawae TaxID=34407 RepID=A0AAD9Y7I3_COLKA|nr:hypothetical protein CKAH01_01569 [Colletotrichum kahawae]